MLQEVHCASDFLVRYLHQVSPDQASSFQDHLATILRSKCQSSSWDPSRPFRGSAFRAIFCAGGKVDPVIILAGQAAGIPQIESFFNVDLVLWVDPHCVSYRQGSDHGHIITLWEDRMSITSSTQQHNPYASSASIPITSAAYTSAPSTQSYTPATSATTPTLPSSSILSSPGLVVFPQKTRVVMRLPEGADPQSFGGSPNTSPSMQRLRSSTAQQQPRSIVVN
ncbi:Protein btg2 [Phlyctochytrium planicorne]|nr:Protein btg2 [Phlyctochytrium planicorne]